MALLKAIYRFCLLSLARLAAGAVIILDPDKFGYWDKLLVSSIFIVGIVAIIYLFAWERKRG